MNISPCFIRVEALIYLNGGYSMTMIHNCLSTVMALGGYILMAAEVMRYEGPILDEQSQKTFEAQFGPIRVDTFHGERIETLHVMQSESNCAVAHNF
jgi:hypothetical protein